MGLHKKIEKMIFLSNVCQMRNFAEGLSEPELGEESWLEVYN